MTSVLLGSFASIVQSDVSLRIRYDSVKHANEYTSLYSQRLRQIDDQYLRDYYTHISHEFYETIGHTLLLLCFVYVV